LIKQDFPAVSAPARKQKHGFLANGRINKMSDQQLAISSIIPKPDGSFAFNPIGEHRVIDKCSTDKG
jgi:hypothetical protein